MSVDQIAEICSHISETEATAAAAERRTIDRFAAALFQTRTDHVVDGIIASVTGFGAFVRLEDGAADGLMPLNALPDDFYDYDEQAQMLKGRHNGWQFNVGMHVRVKVTEVTPISGGILVEWVEGGLQVTTKYRKAKNHEKTLWENSNGCSRPVGQTANRRSAKEKAANEKDVDDA